MSGTAHVIHSVDPAHQENLFYTGGPKNINEASKRLRANASNKWVPRARAILARRRKTRMVAATADSLLSQAISEMQAGVAFDVSKEEEVTRKELFATIIVGLMTVTAAYAADAPAASAPADASSDASAKPPKAKKTKAAKKPAVSAAAKAPAAQK